MRQKIIVIIVGSSSFLLSLASAFAVDAWLNSPMLWHSIGLQRAYNTGIAFSIDLGPLQTPVIVGAILLVCYMASKTADTTLQQIGFGLLLGGAFSNIVDRLLDGKVTDMLRIGNFPIFNVADTCINIGVGLIILQAVLEKYKKTA